ncbi:unnamed protein product [Schistosoma rodhaini]|uniref:EDRF1 N-terminal domain-containing protein n=1 Tax=Schistosoma rodhaini TaxID=6188 RepID=A0AA85FWM0_9TREM|nr:unnamed protein product [Schistosoma rodhaini]CAH8572054.1 unnamed protein product [Schistosoma rodhaini]
MDCNTQNQSSDESDKLHETREKENRQTAICANFEKSIVLWSPGDIGSMVLHEGFNLHRMPKNYLTRKSYIEKLIYHATMSDSMKSPFAGFKVANEYLNELDHIDVISGIKTFKSFIRSFFKNNSRASTMIHKVGRTWLLNEFDIDSFLLSGGECHEWLWLREFLKKEDYRLCSHSLSRNVLISHDLESKFLYHTVFQSPELGLKKIQMLQPKSLPSSSGNDHTGNEITKKVVCSRLDPSSVGVEHSSMVDIALSSSLDDTVTTSNVEADKESRQFRSSWVINPDQYLHTAEWQLKDLSFIVGSDMPIFGTPKHPCISLKLSPLHESINVLTGIDVWLENIINEVPEVAMCYHHEGIVMQEYEIYKTCEIPPIIGFETEQINQIIRNLVMFLKRNATQEGHTYWLVKEPGLGVVKLYDLTTLGYKEFLNKCSKEPNGREAYMKDNNPFILPVASLCYKLAEIRVKEYIHYRENQIFQSTTFDSFNLKSSSSPRRYSTDNNDFNEVTTVMDALRLLRNCLNLISVHENFSNISDLSDLSFNSSTTSPGIQDLKFRAVLLLCRLYLITPTNVIMTCFKDIQGLICSSRETVSVNIEQFGKSLNSSESNTFIVSDENEKQITSTTNNLTIVPINSNRNYLGSMIIDALRKSNTSQLSKLAISILGSFNRNLAYGHHQSNLTNTNNPDKMLTPYSSSVNNHHHHQNCSAESYDNDIIINKTNEMNDSQTYSLPFAVLKSYIAKSEELWFMVYQQMHHTDTILNPIVIESLNMIFQYTLPALMLLEHLVPDKYTHCLLTLNEQHEKQIQQLSMKKPICPYCYSSCDLIKDSLDRCCLSDTLFIVSCLFSAAFISYPEAIQRTNITITSNHYQQDKKKNSELSTPSSVDTFIMQSACEQSKIQMKIYLNTVLLGPVKLSKKLSPGIEKLSDDDSSDILTKYTNWFNALNLAACCLQRIFLQSINTTHRQQRQHHSRKSNSSMMFIMKQRANKFESSHDLKAYMNKLKITNDWWSVLMNMFVCCLRSMWLDCVSDNQDEIIHLNFNKFLDQYLDILLCNPFDSSSSITSTDIVDITNTTTTNNNSNMSMISYQLIDTNEFQLYKLLALCSQSSSTSSSSFLLPWANKLSSLKKWRSNQDHCLPNETLYFNQQHSSKASNLNNNNPQNYKKFQFSLTTVCLARSIETLLHYQLYTNQNAMPSIQICLDLLLTTNEYLSICLEEFKTIQGDKLEYLDIVNNVLKQVLRYLPSDLTPYSITSSSSATNSLTTTESDNNNTNMAVNKDILRIFVNLRLYQLNVMLLRHHHGVTFKRGKSQTPAWFTMIAQARTTLDWHASYLASHINTSNSKGEDKHLNIDLQDVILHVTLLSHLVSLQTVNQDVLSIFGIQAILRDICRIHPILKLLINSPDDYFTTNPLYSNLQGPLNSISNNLIKLCDTLTRKSQIKRENKFDLKLTYNQHLKKTKHKNSVSNNRLTEQNNLETNNIYHENFSPESLLLSNIKKQQQQQSDNFLTTKQTINDETNNSPPPPPCQVFNSHCQVLQCQIEYLTKYLSEL